MKLFLKLRKQRRRPAEMLLNGLTRKCSSEHRRGRGTLQRKVGKRLPQGPHKRRGGASARCRRHRSSGDARRRHRRSRLAPERGCHEVTGVKKARLRSKRRGPGICPAQGHRRMARLASPHQRTGAVAGLCHGKVRKRLERRRGPGICPVLNGAHQSTARDFAP